LKHQIYHGLPVLILQMLKLLFAQKVILPAIQFEKGGRNLVFAGGIRPPQTPNFASSSYLPRN
jgi:hypothetical protein